MESLHPKYEMLKENLKALGSVAVAFSGGVDSALLLWAAHDALGDRAIAVTAASCLFPEREGKEAAAFCAERGIAQVIVQTEALKIEGFRQNPRDRCYLCKRQLFQEIWKLARERGIAAIVEGSNVDDEGDYRPGLVAVRELGVRSPLREVGLNKAEIRALSKELGLPGWNKQSFACLASRFVYGEIIDEEKLEMVDRAEQRLIDLGFHQLRVRIHGTIARIELLPEEFEKFMAPEVRKSAYEYMRSLGFSYVTLDLGGYRTGSMNETLETINE